MTIEYQIGRTNLFVGILKTLNQNKHINVPIKLFEISDIMHKAEGYDVGACNERYLCAVYMSTSAGFEHIHGLLDRIMLLLEIPKTEPGSLRGYYIREAKDVTFFPGMTAEVVVNGNPIGIFGVLHPEVLHNYDVPFPASALHINIESFL
jgi:phenylalanyl-tRNA synthetase beta chain